MKTRLIKETDEGFTKAEFAEANIVEGRENRVHRMPPSADRWKERSRFFEGVATGMADQWGDSGPFTQASVLPLARPKQMSLFPV